MTDLQADDCHNPNRDPQLSLLSPEELARLQRPLALHTRKGETTPHKASRQKVEEHVAPLSDAVQQRLPGF
jgi:hypothetical protein